MSPGLRRACAAALVLFLGWQTVLAAIEIGREAAAVPAGERKRALVSSESERVERALVWIDLYRAIETHVPEEAIVAFCFPLNRSTFDGFYQVVPMIYPRRAIPINRKLPQEVVEGIAEASRKLSPPSYVIDFASGFHLPAKRSLVAEGSYFKIFRVDR
jgi:hypothetical protein